MDHSAIVTRLSTEANSGTPDAAQAAVLLATLLRTYAAYSAPVATPPTVRGYAERYAAWEADVAALYTAYDRGVRALMAIAQEIADRYPDAPTDARGNPIPVELRGEPIDAVIRGYDPMTPLSVPAVGVSVAGDARFVANHIRSELNVFNGESTDYDASFESATNCCHAYQSAREHPPHQLATDAGSYAPLDARTSEYLRAKAQAEKFTDYLDAT